MTQYQYIEWPDHGLPVNTSHFLDLSKKADRANSTRGPLIIHCSAGLGRSGTFIMINSVLATVKYDMKKNPQKEASINIPEKLLDIRKQRPDMVQTDEQYLFCYLAINDAIAIMTSTEKQNNYFEFSLIRQKLLEQTKEDN